MTDPRIEAVARELKRLFSEGETIPNSMWLSCAKCALDAADAVVAGTSPDTITIPEVRNDRPIETKNMLN